jgi:hypothetical protein
MPRRLFKRIVVHHPRPLQSRDDRSEQIKFLFRTRLGRRELDRLTLRLVWRVFHGNAPDCVEQWCLPAA